MFIYISQKETDSVIAEFGLNKQSDKDKFIHQLYIDLQNKGYVGPNIQIDSVIKYIKK